MDTPLFWVNLKTYLRFLRTLTGQEQADWHTVQGMHTSHEGVMYIRLITSLRCDGPAEQAAAHRILDLVPAWARFVDTTWPGLGAVQALRHRRPKIAVTTHDRRIIVTGTVDHCGQVGDRMTGISLKSFQDFAETVPDEQRRKSRHVTHVLRSVTPDPLAVELITDLPDGDPDSTVMAASIAGIFCAWMYRDHTSLPRGTYTITSAKRQPLVKGGFGNDTTI